MRFLSLFFDEVDFKRVSIGVLIVVVLALGAAVKIQHDQLATAKLVYQNPQVRIVVKTLRVAGPVRIVTRTIVAPSGEQDTTTVEERGQIVESTGASSESTPVPLAVALASARTDRWLCGLGLDNFSPNTLRSYRVYGGYSFKNRLDVLYGLGYRDSLDQQVVAIVRF